MERFSQFELDRAAAMLQQHERELAQLRAELGAQIVLYGEDRWESGKRKRYIRGRVFELFPRGQQISVKRIGAAA